MIYRIKLTKKAARDFKGLDNSVRQIILKVFEKIAANPDSGKPLEHELKDMRSYRTGSYRVIYTIYKEEIHVLVVAIGHRREVYEKLRKLLK